MELLDLIQTSRLAFAFVAVLFGLVIGSFLNVVIYRTPIVLMRRWQHDCQDLAGQPSANITPPERFNLVTPRSRCPHCGHAITALENIPLLSYLWLGGKCSACRKPISLRYPFVELLSGVLAVSCAWHFGFGVAGLAAIALTWLLIALAFIDIDHQLLPDVMVLPFLWLGLLLNIAGVFTSLPSAVIGATAGYLSLWLVFHIFKLVTGKEGMGYGDFKLLALFGAWLGWQSLPLIILLSSLVGALIGIGLIIFRGRDRAQPLPFGPYLAAAGWVALLWGDRIVAQYLQIARF
jgi:leader peptidase (prepilin peptidase) / N-methyltransferase